MLPLPAVPAGDSWAVFLDVDGTLLDIADAPHRVVVNDRILRLLRSLLRRHDGAVALVSGRSVADLDRLFEPEILPAAGLHGAERRDARGVLHRHIPNGRLDALRGALAAFEAEHPGTLVEDKGAALALHYRLAPGAASAARRCLEAEVGRMGGDFVLQEGKCVLEIKPAGVTKATAIAEFMREEPFAGRGPVFLGDDLTDEDGFGLVKSMGGLAIAVGERPGTRADFGLPDVGAVLGWLESFATMAPQVHP